MARGRCPAWRGDMTVTGWGLACCGGMSSVLAWWSEALGDVASCAASCGSKWVGNVVGPRKFEQLENMREKKNRNLARRTTTAGSHVPPVEMRAAMGSGVACKRVATWVLRFRRTYGPYHFILSYLPLSRSTIPLSCADTSDCLFPISYPLSPHIFDRPWHYLVALLLSSYPCGDSYPVRYIGPQSSVTIRLDYVPSPQ